MLRVVLHTNATISGPARASPRSTTRCSRPRPTSGPRPLHTVDRTYGVAGREERSGHSGARRDGSRLGCGWATYGDFRDSERWPGYRFTVEHSIHVREESWGRGIGRALINALVERARREGKHVMVAGIDSENTGSIRFHERRGFWEVGRLPEIGEKFGRRLDLVLMQRMLDT